MKNRKITHILKFSDGSLSLFNPGEEEEKAHYRFSSYSFGVRRFNEALMNGVRISKCVSIPKSNVEITGNETVVILGKKFGIYQVEDKPYTLPRSVLLTLREFE